MKEAFEVQGGYRFRRQCSANGMHQCRMTMRAAVGDGHHGWLGGGGDIGTTVPDGARLALPDGEATHKDVLEFLERR